MTNSYVIKLDKDTPQIDIIKKTLDNKIDYDKSYILYWEVERLNDTYLLLNVTLRDYNTCYHQLTKATIDRDSNELLIDYLNRCVSSEIDGNDYLVCLPPFDSNLNREDKELQIKYLIFNYECKLMKYTDKSIKYNLWEDILFSSIVTL